MKPIASLLGDSLRNYRHARTTLLATIFLLAALAALPCVAAAQALYGALTGTVTDKTGAVVPNVAITVTNQDTGAVRTTNHRRAGRLPRAQTCCRAPTPSR